MAENCHELPADTHKLLGNLFDINNYESAYVSLDQDTLVVKRFRESTLCLRFKIVPRNPFDYSGEAVLSVMGLFENDSDMDDRPVSIIQSLAVSPNISKFLQRLRERSSMDMIRLRDLLLEQMVSVINGGK